MGQYDDIKKQIVTTAQMLTQKGYLIATGGNLSIRIPGQDAFAITPTNYDYMKMVLDDVCVLDFDIHTLEGERKPSVESAMRMRFLCCGPTPRKSARPSVRPKR